MCSSDLAFPDLLDLRAAELGADNEAVLTGIGAMSTERYEELVRAGVLITG